MLTLNNFSGLYIMTIKGGKKSRPSRKHRRKETKHKRSTKHRRTKHHKKSRTKTRTKHRKKRKTKRRMRGGGTGIAPKGGSPAAPFSGAWGGHMSAFPSGPIYKPGVDNDAKFYGKLNKPFYPDPVNTHGTGVTKTNSTVKKGGKRKSRKGGKRQRGGSISQFLSNNIPGFSDIRDVYWKGGEVAKNGYNTWFGFDKTTNTSSGVQPIGKNKNVERPKIVNIPQVLKSGALEAKKYSSA